MITRAPGFFEKLRAAQLANDSWLCVGLDPVTHPVSGLTDADSLLDACLQIVAATSDVVCAYKPNLAFFLQNGARGIDTLGRLIDAIPRSIPVLLDAKFGDIGQTQTAYRHFVFETLRADAVTLNPYVGTDSLLPFLTTPAGEPDPEHGIIVLCRTSNVQGNDFQPVGSPSLYAQVATSMTNLATRYPNQIGLVVGATQPESELSQLRDLAPNLPFLMPGVGRQGGDLTRAVRYGLTSDGLGPLINIGGGLVDNQPGDSFAEGVRAAALAYRMQINAFREKV